MADAPATPAVAPHGSHRLPAVDVDSYNVELKDDDIGRRSRQQRRVSQYDRAYKKNVAQVGMTRSARKDSEELSKAELESFLQGQPEAAGIIHTAIEDFSTRRLGPAHWYLRPRSVGLHTCDRA